MLPSSWQHKCLCPLSVDFPRHHRDIWTESLSHDAHPTGLLATSWVKLFLYPNHVTFLSIICTWVALILKLPKLRSHCRLKYVYVPLNRRTQCIVMIFSIYLFMVHMTDYSSLNQILRLFHFHFACGSDLCQWNFSSVNATWVSNTAGAWTVHTI